MQLKSGIQQNSAANLQMGIQEAVAVREAQGAKPLSLVGYGMEEDGAHDQFLESRRVVTR